MSRSTNYRDDVIRKLNEAGGKLFEALSDLMLRDALPRRHVKWQPQCKYMLIQPDFCLGDEQKPDAIILVTHATARNAAGVKVDRSLEELFQAKTRSPISSVPKVINLIFHSPVGWANGQLLRLDCAFDFNWVAFRDSPTYRSMLPQLASLAKGLVGLPFDEAVKVTKKTSIHKALARELAPQLRVVLAGNHERHKYLWSSERKRLAKKVSTNRSINNQLKKDLMALVMVPQKDMRILLKGESVDLAPEFEPGIAAGSLSVRESILECKVELETDLRQRMMQLSRAVSPSVLSTAMDKFLGSEGFSSYRMVYEPLDESRARLERLFEVSSSKEVFDLITASWSPNSTLYTGTCWPIEYTITALQEVIDREYGMLWLYRQVATEFEDAFNWNPLTWYVIGHKDAIKENELRSLSESLYINLKQLQTKVRVTDSLVEKIQSGLETKLRRKKKANPLLWLVQSCLEVRNLNIEGFPGPLISRLCPFSRLANLSQVSGQIRWHFLVSAQQRSKKRRLLHVLSSYSQTHKHKEYAVKGRQALYSVDETILRDPAITEVGILLDGVWSVNEVNLLENSGARIFDITDYREWGNWACVGSR